MLRKIRSSSLRQFFSFVAGGDPTDEWEFRIPPCTCRIVNGWRSGVSLFVDGRKVAWNGKKIAVSGDKPLLAVEIDIGDSRSRRVEVFVKAVAAVTVHVRVDGVPVQEGFA